MDRDEPDVSSETSPPDPESEAKHRARRRQHANAEVARLTQYGVVLSVLAASLGLLAQMAGIPGAENFVPGLTVGCVVATINLRLLAQGAWSILSGEGVIAAIFGFGFSLLLLVSTALWLVLAHASWLIGFGVGLGLPAAVGLWYGWHLSRAEGEDPPADTG